MTFFSCPRFFRTSRIFAAILPFRYSYRPSILLKALVMHVCSIYKINTYRLTNYETKYKENAKTIFKRKLSFAGIIFRNFQWLFSKFLKICSCEYSLNDNFISLSKILEISEILLKLVWIMEFIFLTCIRGKAF